MFRKILKSFGIGQPAVGVGAISAEINLRPVSDIRSEAEALLAQSDLWDISFCRNPEEPRYRELGPLNQVFFRKYADVRAKFMSLQLGYLGRPDWLPKRVNQDLQLVGHTVEQEFLFCTIHNDELFEMVIDGLFERSSFTLKSAYHAVLFYHVAYAKK
jgi:hypothetical protein